MTPKRKLLVTGVMFAAAAALVFVAAATKSTAPLFVMFLPLLVVPWALTRREPGPSGAPSHEPESNDSPNLREPDTEVWGPGRSQREG